MLWMPGLHLQDLMFELLCVSFPLVILFLALRFLPFETVMFILYHCNLETHNGMIGTHSKKDGLSTFYTRRKPFSRARGRTHI